MWLGPVSLTIHDVICSRLPSSLGRLPVSWFDPTKPSKPSTGVGEDGGGPGSTGVQKTGDATSTEVTPLPRGRVVVETRSNKNHGVSEYGNGDVAGCHTDRGDATGGRACGGGDNKQQNHGVPEYIKRWRGGMSHR